MKPVSIIHGLAAAGYALTIGITLAVWAWLRPKEAEQAAEAMKDHLEQD